MPITAAPDIRAASKVNSTGPIPGFTDPSHTARASEASSHDTEAPAESDVARTPNTPAPSEVQRTHETASPEDFGPAFSSAPQAPQVSSAEPQAAESQAPESQAAEWQSSEWQSPELHDSESEPKESEPKPAHARHTGPRWTSGTNGETVPVTHGGRTYKTKQGDTLYGVASRHGVSVPALAELNRISPRQNLHQGQVLSLPEKNDLPDTDPSHVVAPGETLHGIAARHHMAPSALRRANSMGDDSFLKVGELLLLRDSTAKRHRIAPEPPADVPRVATSAQVEGIRPDVLRAARLNKFTLLQRTHPAPAQARLLVASIAEELGAEPALMQAVAAQESGFQHTTVSAGNAIGIMQVTPRSGRWASDIVGRALDLLDIADNIVAGTVILGWLIETAESENEALAGYYQDLRSVRSEGLLPETKAFVRAVQMQRPRMQVAL